VLHMESSFQIHNILVKNFQVDTEFIMMCRRLFFLPLNYLDTIYQESVIMQAWFYLQELPSASLNPDLEFIVFPSLEDCCA
jgi:hypothetical protein